MQYLTDPQRAYMERVKANLAYGYEVEFRQCGAILAVDTFNTFHDECSTTLVYPNGARRYEAD